MAGYIQHACLPFYAHATADLYCACEFVSVIEASRLVNIEVES